MTYGQLKLRLTQAFPGISLDLIEGWANDRYQEIMAELPWTRKDIQAVLPTLIGKAIYPLPTDCRLLADDAFSSSLGSMERFTHEQLNASDPNRAMTGTPQAWATVMDDNSTPPRIQVEIWPTPDAVVSLPFTYQSTAGDLTAEATILQVWMQPAALHEGIVSRIKAHKLDYQGGTFHAALAKAALATMRGSEANGLAPGQMQLDSYYTRHRLKRTCR